MRDGFTTDRARRWRNIEIFANGLRCEKGAAPVGNLGEFFQPVLGRGFDADSSASRFIQSLNQPRRLLSKSFIAAMLDAAPGSGGEQLYKLDSRGEFRDGEQKSSSMLRWHLEHSRACGISS